MLCDFSFKLPKLHTSDFRLENRHRDSLAQLCDHFNKGVFPNLISLRDAKLSVEKKSRKDWRWSVQSRDGYVKGDGWVDRSLALKTGHIKNLKGEYIFFSSWFEGNYGHMLHDHLPVIAWLKEVFPLSFKFILVYSSVKEQVLKVLDASFLKRVVWIKPGDLINVNGNLIVVNQLSVPLIRCNPFVLYLKEWLRKRLHKLENMKSESLKIVYYSRNSNRVTDRIMSPLHEKNIIEKIMSCAERSPRTFDFRVFNGEDENGDVLSIEEQEKLFKDAEIIIGPHGTGLVNLLWSKFALNGNLKLLEFMPSDLNESVFDGGFGRCYYPVLQGLDFNYHQVCYTPESTKKEMFVAMRDLDLALDSVFSIV